MARVGSEYQARPVGAQFKNFKCLTAEQYSSRIVDWAEARFEARSLLIVVDLVCVNQIVIPDDVSHFVQSKLDPKQM